MCRARRVLILEIAFLFGTLGVASAQPSLIGGGLTEMPQTVLGPNLAQNDSFETLSGGLPINWSNGSGWSVDQLVQSSGLYSYRRVTGAGHATQTVQLKKGIYKFSAWIKTESLGSGTTSGIRLQLDFRPAVNDWKTTDVISGTRDWALYEIKNIVVPENRTAVLKLENFGNPAGTAWFDAIELEEQLPQPVEVFLLYPNYRGMLFDDQPQTMTFDVTVTPPGGDFSRYTVRAVLADEWSGNVVATREYSSSASFVAELDGSLMQESRPYLASFVLVDRSNDTVVYTYPSYRLSKVPGAARQSMNISVDARNRILVKGVPRFVLGVYDSGGSSSTADSFWEDQLWSPAGQRRLDGLRINFYLNYWLGATGADAIKALMANLQKRDVVYLQTGNCFDKWPAGTNFLIHSSDSYVHDIGAHPGSAGYYTIDECRSELVPEAFNQYVRLRQLDPDSMTFAALLGHLDVALWRDAADILASDPYPLFSTEPFSGYNHRQVADWTAQTRTAVKDARPFLTVLQFFKFTSLGRWPTRQEMRNHAYMAIVEGAKGLWWWSVGNANGALASLCSDWCAERVAHLDDLKAVIAELAELEPVLLAQDTPGALTGNSQAATIRTKVKVLNGRGYVFAYNYTNQTVAATLTWNAPPGTVTVPAEGRTLTPGGNSFSDTFGPYQAHVYVINSVGTNPPGGSAALSVSAGAGAGAGVGAAAASGITVAPQSSVTVTLTNGRGGATDWLALAPSGAPDSAFLQWVYVGAGITTRTWTVSMPATAGTYEFRYFPNNGFARAATSPLVTVNGATSPALTVDRTTVAGGGPVTLALANGQGGATDWLALAPTGAPDSTFLQWVYVGAGVTTRTWTVSMPPTAGTYEFRYFPNNGFARAATSPLVTVNGATSPALTVDRTTVAGGGSVTLALTNGQGGATDWLALALAGAPNSTFLQWIYVGAGVTTRTWTVSMPAAAGAYEFRYFPNNGFVRTASSPVVTVSGATSPALTVDRTTVARGGSVTLTLANGQGGATDWLAIAPAGAANSTYLQWIYVGAGVATRTWTVSMPATAGTYEFRYFPNNGFVRAGTSPAVIVSP